MTQTRVFPRRFVLRAAAGTAAATMMANSGSAVASLAGQQWQLTREPGGARHLKVGWDEWAVPTVSAKDEFDVTYGVGYVQARTNAREILDIYGRARGGAAALWGPDYLAEDEFTIQLGLHTKTDLWTRAQKPKTLARVRAFCEGFNAACSENAELGGDRREILPVTPRDIIAHLLRASTRFTTLDSQGLAFPPDQFTNTVGSNGWAVSGGRSTTGHAMLVINPHLVWRGYQRFFEMRTRHPGRDFHGVTLLGLPWQQMGYSPAVGWGHTVNPVPNMSVYDLNLSGNRYLYNGRQRRLKVTEHRVEVRGVEPVMVVERHSVHGPVVTAPDGTDVAVRIAGVLHHPATSALESWWRLSFATSVQELFKIHDGAPLPLFNMIAADAHGSIGALYCGTPPVRAHGDFDDSKRRLPGDDPKWLWRRVHQASRMPRVINPESGWVQNCNETPWLYTDPPLPAENWPSAIAPSVDQVDDFRPIASRRWLKAQKKISPEQLLGLKFSKRALLADVVLDELLAAATGETDLEDAVQVLTAWDRQANQDSEGYVLFYLWSMQNLSGIGDKTLFRCAAEPGGLPTGLADPAAAVATLRDAKAILLGTGAPLDASVGQVVSLGDGPDAIPGDGGSGVVGVLKAFEIMPTADGFKKVLGDTWVSLVQFRPVGETTAESVLVYGNATEPGAPPSQSQYAVWASDRLRT
ncbi:penicillin acylase family protein [Streptomyces alfalfae]|uniref:penicillin acylase family protein n=1 Tax=Streptomyces alfalfae TaxID=1642299 RepID=UPI001BA55FBC|nr:penicillin acylase family protein [Streptomyces alfalfae]QUI35350.1 penicillin acylase family protein [Streptomyces alfalfae]